ncbi:MAG: hypothetical protein PHU42_01140 [Patescibacteria group bacterium]|nr:hypothetical protein [Patescibacteria group bacterium]
MKKVLLAVLAILLLFPALAKGEIMLSVQSEALSFTEASARVAAPVAKEEKKDIFQKMEAKLKKTALKALFHLNLRLTGNGKALSLGQDKELKISKKRVQIVWTRPSKKELALQVTRTREVKLGYTFEY